MKLKLIAFTKTLISTSLIKAAIPTLLILGLQSICLGQVYSYVDTSVGETDVIGYSAVTGYYNSSTHVYTTTSTLTSPTGRTTTASNSGTSVTAYLSIQGEVGWFGVNTQFYGTCPGGGYTHVIGGNGGGVQTCADTCTPCRVLRQSQTGTCNINLTSCEGAAVTAYIAALLLCENNAFCQSDNPNFNQEECDRCKQTVTAAFVAATAVCGTIYYQCLGNRVDCETGFYKNTVCATPCSNP